MAGVATLMYLLNPAAIFMTGIYTTSIFSCFSIAGLYYTYADGSLRTRFVASVLFGLATATRSNGSLLFIFPLCVTLRKLWKEGFRNIIFETVVLGLLGLIHAFGIFGVLIYGAMIYCTGPNYSTYCDSLLPNIYSYVQKQYWQVGMFKYWQVKQVGNFILPLPMLYFGFNAVWHFYWTKDRKIPFVLYTLVNLLILTFIANIQITTRVLASNPLIYWYISRSSPLVQKLYLFYSFGYTLIGTCLFTNFYPWT